MTSFSFAASDGYALSVSEYLPDKSARTTVLINSATGVPQRYYDKFARFLATQGYAVYTYDYRGIGTSKPATLVGFKASMRDWADKDFGSLLTYLRKRYSADRLVVIGHSFGGNCLGLTAASQQADVYITVGSQFGYWRYFWKRKQPLLLWLFGVVMPLVSHLVGYFPSRVKALGESLPKQVALDWVKLMLRPRSMLSLAEEGTTHYAQLTQPMLLISIEDDWQAPKAAVDALATRAYRNAQVERRHVRLTDAGAKAIGHLRFFRPQFEQTLWTIPVNWLAQLPQ